MDAIVQILRDNGKAMPYRDIAEQIVERQLRTKIGATPYATVSATITTDTKQNDKP